MSLKKTTNNIRTAENSLQRCGIYMPKKFVLEIVTEGKPQEIQS
jgi:hypothetical protein